MPLLPIRHKNIVNKLWSPRIAHFNHGYLDRLLLAENGQPLLGIWKGRLKLLYIGVIDVSLVYA